jgi:hypothetical protein
MLFLQIPLQRRKGGIFKVSSRQIFHGCYMIEILIKYFAKSVKKTMSSGVSLPKKSSRVEESIKAFTQSGFSSWNKAIERFKKHEKSDVHCFCLLHKTNLERGVNVHSMLSKRKLEDMKTARITLLKMISTLRFLMT